MSNFSREEDIEWAKNWVRQNFPKILARTRRRSGYGAPVRKKLIIWKATEQ